MANPPKRHGPARRASVLAWTDRKGDRYEGKDKDLVDYVNTLNNDFYPNKGGKGNIDGSATGKSSAMPTGKKDFDNHNGSVNNEPARQRRLGKDVTPAGPKPRSKKKDDGKKKGDSPFFKVKTTGKK